ncbi:MAG TPA: ABC transporter permease [Gemmataceae bacterium]|nr:ABC transporter permease [Gemmataceae bacterium]
MKFFLLILKNLRRNKLRTALTALATMVLVFVVTMIWTVVYFLEAFTQEKSGNLKAIVTERWQMPSQMPLSYVGPLSHGAARKAGDKEPKDSMAWQFYIGTLDAVKKTRENMVVLVAMDVRKLPRKSQRDGKVIITKGMIDDLDPIDEALIEKLAQTTQGCLLGKKRLKALNKKVGERFKITGLEYTGIDLEFEIIGVLPEGRWDENGFMNERYLNNAIDAYKGFGGTKHPLDQRRLNMFWVEVGNKEDFSQVIEQINTSPTFSERPVKCETFASLIANFLDSYSGFIWFIQWVLVPGSMFSMVLLIANAISLNVRERTKEMAVLKVMGFQPWQLLVLVLGEALLLGTSSGLLAGGLIYFIANTLAGGITLPGSEPFPVPWMAVVWGASVGGATALLGSFLPAWTARTIKASEVFARVA